MRYLKYLFWIILIVFAIIFSTLNSHTISLNYYLNTATVSLPVLLLCDLALGIVLCLLIMFPAIWRAKADNRRLKQYIRQLEREFKNSHIQSPREEHEC